VKGVPCTWVALAVGFGLAQPNGLANRARGPFPNRGGTQPWRQPRWGGGGPVHPATTSGEGGGGSGLGHEGVVGIPIEAKTGRRLTRNQASHGGEARAERNIDGGTDRRSVQQAGWSGSCTGSPWCLRRKEWGGLDRRRCGTTQLGSGGRPVV
jgi:hypothetical protein